ncbi:LLM class flavin-dependent oxidoreductase [Metabacillus fastidiosus]|uniref:LLM class flavin-dependent oxidoreductase n=1 Tax=Metabacillus fastidiosus TaxID=1458 RepID=UPI0008258639|nr:LLM class flavin-dependent oxidoreductase [Metabacillus fastidiosus]MED4463693.1 LLM class flavin-dependent oxidoreductase [Metabacillus fastidiosus]
MVFKLSILDQSPIRHNETAFEAFQNTIKLAKKAEELGYDRFWVSEHHHSDELGGSAPEILISYLLAETKSIRIGSGGVMLQHYSPYKVAEQFNVLASLSPGRVDLGVGKGPGGLPLSTRALQIDRLTASEEFSEKLLDLKSFIQNDLPSEHKLFGLHATPIPPEQPEIFLLGASVESAELAAKLGISYVFAQFINSDENVLAESARTFHSRKLGESKFIVALSIVVGQTDGEAEELVTDYTNIKIKLASGKRVTVKTIEQAEQFISELNEEYTIEIKEAHVIKGSKETVRSKLLQLKEELQLDEIIVVTPVEKFEKKLQSYILLKEAFEKIPVE